MIILRIAGGIREHFPARVSEWIMTGAVLGWYGILVADPSTFEVSRSFAVMAHYASQSAWALLCLIVGFVRLTALIVNGTFQSFPYSPHLRAVASFAAAFMWGLITLGVVIAWSLGGAGTGIVAYGIFTVFEMWNLMRAAADAGAARRTV